MIKMPHGSFIFMCLSQNELIMNIEIFKPTKTTSLLLCFYCYCSAAIEKPGIWNPEAGIVMSWGPPLAVGVERSSQKPS